MLDLDTVADNLLEPAHLTSPASHSGHCSYNWLHVSYPLPQGFLPLRCWEILRDLAVSLKTRRRVERGGINTQRT